MRDTLVEYETIIGLEVHVQLLTRSKMFCGCRADYQAVTPNTLVCPVCLGMPGALPVINKRAVELTMMTGLALNCRIPVSTKFDRKNYPYPDLMKGYQISQYDSPIAVDGCLDIDVDGHTRRVGITRVHLEEDVAKLQHVRGPSGDGYSLVDVNRSGVPLMEVVSEPDMRSPEEARQYLTSLRAILQYLEVSTGNMEEGSFRCDANVSVRSWGTEAYGTRTEVKNMNSFRAVYNALKFEVERQINVVEDGGRVIQETRGWLEEQGATVSQRTKEYAHDYRYFPEPDLPPLSISPSLVEEVRAGLPDLPRQRRERFVSQYSLTLYDANLLTSSKAMADFFEACLQGKPVKIEEVADRAKSFSNWMLGEVSRFLNASSKELSETPLTPNHIVELVELVDSGNLSNTLAKDVLEDTFNTGKAPREVVKERGYVQISDTSVVASAVAEAIEENAPAVADYLKGKETAANFLVGQVMKLTLGKANPALVNQLVREKLEELKVD